MAIIRKLFGRKDVCLSFFGVLLVNPAMYWPKCHTCQLPQTCLAYTECLKHGSVLLDGRDVCKADFAWTSRGLQTLLQTTNVSLADLACEREDVICESVESLAGGVCSKPGVAWLLRRQLQSKPVTHTSTKATYDATSTCEATCDTAST
jgi:hypothetical protein